MLTVAELVATRKAVRFTPVPCPHCGESLNAQFHLVVASRCCPKCGRRAVAEPDDAGPPPFTPDQLAAAVADSRRATSRVAWLILAAMLWWLLMTVPCGLYRDTISAAVRPLVEPGWFFMLVMLGPFVAIVAREFLRLPAERRAALKCPSCSAVCSHSFGRGLNFTQLTGNCTGCGRRLVDHPVDDPPGPLPSAEEYKAAHARMMRDPLALPALAAFGVLMLGASVAFRSAFDPSRFWSDIERKHGPMAEAWAQIGFAAGGVAVILGGLGGLSYVLHRRQARRQRAEPVLACGECGGVLSPAAVVVACRRCPTCRARVLAGPR